MGTLTTERALPSAPKSVGNLDELEASSSYTNATFKRVAQPLVIPTISIVGSQTPIYRMEFKPVSSTFAPNLKSAPKIASISVVSVKLIVYLESVHLIIYGTLHQSLIVSRTVVLMNRSKRKYFFRFGGVPGARYGTARKMMLT